MKTYDHSYAHGIKVGVVGRRTFAKLGGRWRTCGSLDDIGAGVIGITFVELGKVE
jgi:hypothetical protein